MKANKTIIVTEEEAPLYPTPDTNEAKESFIDKCIATLTAQGYSKEEASNIAYKQWSKSKNAKTLHEELLERFSNIRNLLKETLGKRGEILLDYTLVRLGVFDKAMKNFNMAALSGNMNLPYIKNEDDGSITIHGLIAPPVIFSKIDLEAGTVEGYANTVTIDTYADVFMPEAYKDSFIKTYQEMKSPIYFMHHMDVDAGDLVEMRFDQIGMYIKSKPYPEYLPMIQNGTLKGYSIGFYFKIWPDVVGNAYVTHKKFSIYGNDISYVTNPANLASYFTSTPESAVKERTDKFVENPKPQLKTRNLVNAIKTDLDFNKQKTGTDSFNVGSTNSLKNGKPILKDKSKLSEEKPKKPETEEEQEQEETKVLSPEELMSKSPKELMEYAKKQAARELQQNLASEIIATEKRIIESKAEDKYKNLETKFAQLMAKVDDLATKIETVNAKLAIHDEKMVKMEETVEDVPAASMTATEVVIPIGTGMGFTAYRNSKPGAQ